MDTDSPPRLLALLRRRRFLPFFLVQFSGAFNDNLYRNALLVLLVSGAVAAERVNLWVNLAAGLFILPFFLFSPLAGQLADRCDKARLMRWIKAAEVLIMIGAATALFQQAWAWLLALLFAMGVHSSFFGPLKYAILPQHLGAGDLVAGNALVGMGTFVAILSGTIGGSLLAGSPEDLAYCTNQDPDARTLAPGIYTLSNEVLDTPWPKAEYARHMLTAVLDEPGPLSPDRLLAILGSREQFPDTHLPDTGIGLEMERVLSAPFIVSDSYGTRATTVLTIRSDGEVYFAEQCYRRGKPTGRRDYHFRRGDRPA